MAHSCHPALACQVATGVIRGLSTHRQKGLFGIKVSQRHDGVQCRRCTEMQLFPVLSLLRVKFWNMGLGLLWGWEVMKMRGMFSWKNQRQVERKFYHGQSRGIVSITAVRRSSGSSQLGKILRKYTQGYWLCQMKNVSG